MIWFAFASQVKLWRTFLARRYTQTVQPFGSAKNASNSKPHALRKAVFVVKRNPNSSFLINQL